jgi:hypothetical protein
MPESIYHSRSRERIPCAAPATLNQTCATPPSTNTSLPVIKLVSSESRNKAAATNAQLPAKFRIAAFVARYTPKAGVPLEPVVDPVHSRDDSANLGPTRLRANIWQEAHYTLVGDSITGPIRSRSFHFEVFTPFTISHTHVANSPRKAGSTMAGNILAASEG